MIAVGRGVSSLWRALAILLSGVLVIAACSYEGRSVSPELPIERESTRVYASDGSEITTFFFEQNRTNVSLDVIPSHLQEAVVAIEDERFYLHAGVDLRAILRAARTNASSGDITEGGSTITQQYVKNALIGDSEQTLSRKVEEASLALQLERQYTKDRILELYLNTIFFGNEAYGVSAAAHEYFAKSVQDLTPAEAALLAGLVNSPTGYNPYKHPEAAVERRNLVLERMVSNNYLTRAEADEAIAVPLELTEATPPEVRVYPAPYFVEEVKQWILDDERFGESRQDRRDLLFGGGLRIYTTVDLETQRLAEEAVGAVVGGELAPDAALVAMEPDTGYVRAMVGGRNFFGDAADVDDKGQKLNLATQAFRQPGSSFKPIVLATALEDGIPITAAYPAPGRISLDRGKDKSVWTVSNYGGGGAAGDVTLLEATVRSYNTVYAQLMLDVGAEHAIEEAKAYGIEAPIRPFDAAVLGSELVTPLDMASSYATFANRGVHVPPALVSKILSPDGSILFQHQHTQERVLSTDTTDVLTDALRQNIERGTGQRADIGRPAAGKTGTTSDWRDAWFVGYTPELSTAVWLGYQNADGCRSPTRTAGGRTCFMVPPNTEIRVTGGSLPARLWSAFMGPALAAVPPAAFPATTTTTTSTTVAPTSSVPSAPERPANGDPVIPSLVGLSVEDAEDALADGGFMANRVEVADEDQFPNHVVAQDPPSGTRASPGTVVTIEIRAS